MNLYREFVLKTAYDAKVLWTFVKANASALSANGTPMRVIVTDEELDRLDEQIKYYFGPFMKQVEESAWVEGKRHSKEVWHEYFAKLFLPAREIILPDGEVVVKRGSIARGQIGMKAMAKYQLQVEAYCASELGVVFEEAA